MRAVHTKEQLEQAIADGVAEIVIEGELAMHIHDSRRFPTLTAAAIAALTACIAAIPLTAGVSVAAVPSPTRNSEGMDGEGAMLVFVAALAE